MFANTKMENMRFKGFIFTVDAIFSLIVGSVAISMLLYTYFVVPSSYQAPQSQTLSLIQLMQETSLNQIVQQGLLSQYFINPSGRGVVSFKGYNVSIAASVLQAIAELYLNNRGAYGDILAYTVNPVYTYGIFINNSYAPSLHVASFNGNAAVYAVNTPKVGYNYTISHWIYLYASTGPYNSPTYSGSSPTIDIYNALANGGIGGSQDLDFGGGFAGGTYAQFVWEENGQFCFTPTNSIQPNVWYDVAVSVQSYSNVTIYVNGVGQPLCALTAGEPPLSSMVIPSIAIAANPVGTISLFNGKIADVQLYNQTLPDYAIAGLYKEGIAGLPLQNNGLIGWWPLLGDPYSYASSTNTFAYNVIYNSTSYLPQSFRNAYMISKATLPMVLNVSSGSMLYNISVVIWR